MPAAAEFPVMSRPKRDDVTVKIAAKVYRRAKVIAAHKDIPLAEYLSGLLEGPVNRDHERMLKNMAEEEEDFAS